MSNLMIFKIKFVAFPKVRNRKTRVCLNLRLAWAYDTNSDRVES